MGRHQDNENGKTYTYTYDNLGRPDRMDVSDGNWLQYGYNTVDLATKLRFCYNGTLRVTTYGYRDADNLPAYTIFPSGEINYGYDELTRLTRRAYKTNAGETGVTADYTYLDYSDQTQTTGTVRGIDYTYATGLLTAPDLYYYYDYADNITQEREWQGGDNTTLREKYTYDGKNQLIRHDSVTQNASFTYSYDKAGNITSKNQYAYTTGTLGTVQSTKTYTYSTGSWGDLLTGYDGNAITYDGMGNMTSYNGRTYTWNGRELAQIQGGGNTYSYTYNADGLRMSKTVNGTTTEYFLHGSQVLAQKTGSELLLFYYDSTGNRAAVNYSGILYYYLYNLQGDVIGLARATTGQVVARYSYDAWGNCTVTNASGYTIGTRNPFRYRGYYYDAESGLYYLNSRYYSPEFGRFISADVFVSTGQGVLGANMFAYCGNNPVMGYDPSGCRPIWERDFGNGVIGYTDTGTGEYRTKSGQRFEPYKSADEAAMAFANAYYSSCSYIRHEYGTIIYSRTADGSTTYNYAPPVAGNPHSVGYGDVVIPSGTTKVATAHMHPNSDRFSGLAPGATEGDIPNANRRGLDSYVIGPNLNLQKYSVSSGSVSIVGVASPLALSSRQQASLVLQFRVSWTNHLGTCLFGCEFIDWPTA